MPELVTEPATGGGGDPGDAHAHRLGAIIVGPGLPFRAGSSTITEDGLKWPVLLNRPILSWTVPVFVNDASIHEIVVVVPPDRYAEATALARREKWTRVVVAVAAGGHRRDAVLDGLSALSSSIEWVVVHEATRPLVTSRLVAEGVAAAQRTGAAAAREPIKETVKRVAQGVVTETLDRAKLVRLQTPQVFRRNVLLAIQRRDDPALDSCDNAALALAAGIPVATFPGSHDNIDVATWDDIVVAETLLSRMAPQP